MSLYDHNPRLEHRFLTRRQLLKRCGMGMGAFALADLMSQMGLTQAAEPTAGIGPINPLAPKRPQFAAKAKRVIHIFLNGGLSHVDTLIPNPCSPSTPAS